MLGIGRSLRERLIISSDRRYYKSAIKLNNLLVSFPGGNPRPHRLPVHLPHRQHLPAFQRQLVAFEVVHLGAVSDVAFVDFLERGGQFGAKAVQGAADEQAFPVHPQLDVVAVALQVVEVGEIDAAAAASGEEKSS